MKSLSKTRTVRSTDLLRKSISFSQTRFGSTSLHVRKDPKKRITIQGAIDHPFMKKFRGEECDFVDNDELNEDMLGNESGMLLCRI